MINSSKRRALDPTLACNWCGNSHTLYKIARMGNSKNKSSFFNKEASKERRGEVEPIRDKDRVLLTYIVA